MLPVLQGLTLSTRFSMSLSSLFTRLHYSSTNSFATCHELVKRGKQRLEIVIADNFGYSPLIASPGNAPDNKKPPGKAGGNVLQDFDWILNLTSRVGKG